MTVIVGCVDRNGTGYIAADSRVSWGSTYADTAIKVYRLGNLLVGTSGSVVVDVFMRGFGFEMPTGLDHDAAKDWIVTMIESLHAHLNERGHGAQEGRQHVHDAYLLCVSPSGVWSVAGDGSVVSCPTNGWAEGSGGPEARGAIRAMNKIGAVHGRELVQIAAWAACSLDSGCGGHISIEEVTP